LDGGSWSVARCYKISGGIIYPRDQLPEHADDDDEAGWRITTERPLAKVEAFLSFARLAAHGDPSKEAILDWVHQHGLLHRRIPDRLRDLLSRLPDGTVVHLPDGAMEQEPMSVQRFQEEARRAWRLLRIFELWRSGNAGKLRSRISLRRLDPPRAPSEGLFAEILLDGNSTGRMAFAEEELTDEDVLKACRLALQKAIEPHIAGVHPIFGLSSDKLALRCPDLHSALYWGFASLVDGKSPAAICKGCGDVFEKTRGNKEVCKPGCRTAKKRKRDREKREPPTDTI